MEACVGAHHLSRRLIAGRQPRKNTRTTMTTSAIAS